MPDLLNYLEMVESGEIIERRINQQYPRNQNGKTERSNNSIKKKPLKNIKLL